MVQQSRGMQLWRLGHGQPAAVSAPSPVLSSSSSSSSSAAVVAPSRPIPPPNHTLLSGAALLADIRLSESHGTATHVIASAMAPNSRWLACSDAAAATKLFAVSYGDDDDAADAQADPARTIADAALDSGAVSVRKVAIASAEWGPAAALIFTTVCVQMYFHCVSATN
jgi:hypothetical protein